MYGFQVPSIMSCSYSNEEVVQIIQYGSLYLEPLQHSYFWSLVKDILFTVSGKGSYKYNHQRIMTDDAGSNSIGIKEVFG